MSAVTPLRSPTSPPVFNLPNQLTASRFVLAVGLFVLIEMAQWPWATVVFVVAAFTDWLDGYLARRQGLISTLGRNLDPLVDKILICGAFIFLQPVAGAGVEPWMAVVVVSRELLVSSLRSFLENRGNTFGADWLGKLKMVLQCAALIAILVYLSWPSLPQPAWAQLLRDVLIYAMVISTVISGLQYLLRAALLLWSED
jgi:CDP-diacylglycerol--glycerol-3-phosphate 3-phosphatidyltransferase